MMYQCLVRGRRRRLRRGGSFGRLASARGFRLCLGSSRRLVGSDRRFVVLGVFVGSRSSFGIVHATLLRKRIEQRVITLCPTMRVDHLEISGEGEHA